VDVQTQSTAKPTNQSYRASTGCLFGINCLLDQMRGDDAIEYPQHLTRDLRAAGEADTQLEWKTERLLAHWLVREYLIYEQGRTLGHAARAATRTEPTTLTTEHNQASPVAGLTAYPQ
jgi:hypothetical protein